MPQTRLYQFLAVVLAVVAAGCTGAVTSTRSTAPARAEDQQLTRSSDGGAIANGKVVQSANARCTLREGGVLPDPACSPGEADPRVTQENIQQTICVPGYTKTVRNVPQSLKNQIYSAYGIKRRAPGSFEIDHIISLQLGGANSAKNLFPEAYDIPQGARDKDVIETRLKRMVCRGRMSLAEAQRIISTDWRQAPAR